MRLNEEFELIVSLYDQPHQKVFMRSKDSKISGCLCMARCHFDTCMSAQTFPGILAIGSHCCRFQTIVMDVVNPLICLMP